MSKPDKSTCQKNRKEILDNSSANVRPINIPYIMHLKKRCFSVNSFDFDRISDADIRL